MSDHPTATEGISATEAMHDLATEAAKAIGAYMTFMQTIFPVLKASVTSGLALEQPARDALEALNDFALKHPDVSIPELPVLLAAGLAMSRGTAAIRH